MKENAKELVSLTIEIPDDARSVELTLDQLKETRTFADAYGIMPKLYPVEHHVFINNIIEMVVKQEIECSVGQLSAPIKGIERISATEAEAKGLNQNEAQNTRVSIVVGRIDLGNQYAKKLWNLAIGFMYHEKGIEISIGTNISICSNLTIYGESKNYKNFGRDGITLQEMFVHIEEWLSHLDGIDLENTKLLERMSKVEITVHDTQSFIGQCLKEAIRKNYHGGDPAPLSVTQVSKMTSYIINMEFEFENEIMTLYHLYNAGTFILTHVDDFPSRYSNIKGFTDWFEYNWLVRMERLKSIVSDLKHDIMAGDGKNDDKILSIEEKIAKENIESEEDQVKQLFKADEDPNTKLKEELIKLGIEKPDAIIDVEEDSQLKVDLKDKLDLDNNQESQHTEETDS